MAIDRKKISKGIEHRPPRVIIYGGPSVGKTKFAIGAPNVFLIDADRGSHKFDTMRVEPETWTETKEWIAAVESGEVKCDTLVLDSVTELENKLHKELFGDVGIDSWEKGFGRGDTHALMHVREMLASLERIWAKGKGIILVAHAQIRKYEDPLGGSFERFEIAARPKLSGALKAWADYVLFAKSDVTVQATKSGVNKGVSTGVRSIYTSQSAAYDAKARGTNVFPEKLLLSWGDFMNAVKHDEALVERVEEVKKEIAAMLAEIDDADLNQKVDKYVRENPNMVTEALNSVSARLEKHRAEKSAQQQNA